MRTLLIEPTPSGDASLAVPLTDTGHDVVRCHPSDGPAFPCAGLTQEGCPLHGNEPIDVAIAVRDEPATEPRADEAGVTCAIRAGIPLVVVGPAGPSPFDEWAGASTSTGHLDDLNHALDRAVAASADRRAAPIRAEVERLLALEGVDAGAVEVVVARDGHEAAIRILTEHELSDRVAGLLATRAHAVDQRGTWPTSKLAIEVGRLA